MSEALELDLPLDGGIERAVVLLRAAGVATVESCEGGPGHCFPEPTVQFRGSSGEAWRALSVVMDHHLPVLYLRKQWTIVDNEPAGPCWELVFRSQLSPVERKKAS